MNPDNFLNELKDLLEKYGVQSIGGSLTQRGDTHIQIQANGFSFDAVHYGLGTLVAFQEGVIFVVADRKVYTIE